MDHGYLISTANRYLTRGEDYVLSCIVVVRRTPPFTQLDEKCVAVLSRSWRTPNFYPIVMSVGQDSLPSNLHMNNTHGHVVIRALKHKPREIITIQQKLLYPEPDIRSISGRGACMGCWSGVVAERGRRRKMAHILQGKGYQNWGLSALEGFFIHALIHVSSCKEHLPRWNWHRCYLLSRPSTRPISTTVSSSYTLTPGVTAGKGENGSQQVSTPIKSLLRDETSLPPTCIHLRRTQSNSVPRLRPGTLTEMRNLLLFLRELSRIREYSSLDRLFTLYRALPTPRLSYLRIEEINLLLSCFMSIPVRTDILMIRYLSILDDMRELKLPITRKEWITAISYVGQRCNSKVGPPEIVAVLKLCYELEEKAGAEPGPTLFNILLDMAYQAKQHSLISTILTEMEYRQITHDRYTYTTLLTWYGSIRDKSSVRETFKKLVQHGELVDTVIFNASLLAFIKCKQLDTAEEIFSRMKTLGKEYLDTPMKKTLPSGLNPDGSPISPTRNPHASRQLGKQLKYEAKAHQRNNHPNKVPFPGDLGLQTYCGPNIVTFNIFLHRYCQQGDFEKVTTLLEEMKNWKISMEASIFISMFRGFSAFGEGRTRLSRWTAERIEVVYASLIRKILQERKLQAGAIRLSTVLACEVIWAFAVTTRSRARTMSVYKDMENLYRLGYGHKPEIDPVVRKIIQRAVRGPVEGQDDANSLRRANRGIQYGLQRTRDRVAKTES